MDIVKAQTSTPCHSRTRKELTFYNLRNQHGNLRAVSSSSNRIRSQEECSSSKNYFDAPKSETSRRNKQKSKSRKVCFSSSTQLENSKEISKENNIIDASMMGYDWIAHMVENESIVHQESDVFFKRIKDFRDTNWKQCTITKEHQDTKSNINGNAGTNNHKLKLDFEEKVNVPLCCTGNGAYTLNNRCDLVPIHGPYSRCPICKTKPKYGPWCETEDVRVSIPKSKMESPYNLRPHRRKSFDPSESVSLSSHCLAGWKNSKPNRVLRSKDHIAGLSSELRKGKMKSSRAMKK